MPQAAGVMRNQQVAVLSITVWEINQKVALGTLPRFWGNFPSLAGLLRDQHFHDQAVGWEDAQEAAFLPKLHKDPIDRMFISVALRANLPVITSHRIFADYGVKTIW